MAPALSCNGLDMINNQHKPGHTKSTATRNVTNKKIRNRKKNERKMKEIIDSRRDGSSVDLVNSAGLACRGRGAQRPIDRGEDPDLPKKARCSITKYVLWAMVGE